MILKLENVSYRYKKKGPDILDGVTCGFEGGMLYAMTGESGSGKTTLISIMAKLDRPTGGTIWYDGKDISTMDGDEYRAKRVSVIFQSYNLLHSYTAIDNITTVLDVSGYRGGYGERAGELLDEVGIPKDKRRNAAHELSGGEQQRVAVARALAQGSEVILADEPTGNLDRPNGERVMGLFSDLARRRGKCVIVATHSDFVAGYADLVLRIESGKIAQL